jgi:hypothetical protein
VADGSAVNVVPPGKVPNGIHEPPGEIVCMVPSLQRAKTQTVPVGSAIGIGSDDRLLPRLVQVVHVPPVSEIVHRAESAPRANTEILPVPSTTASGFDVIWPPRETKEPQVGGDPEPVIIQRSLSSPRTNTHRLPEWSTTALGSDDRLPPRLVHDPPGCEMVHRAESAPRANAQVVVPAWSTTAAGSEMITPPSEFHALHTPAVSVNE